MTRLVLLMAIVVFLSSGCRERACGLSTIVPLDSIDVDSVNHSLGTFTDFHIIDSTVLLLTDSGKLFRVPMDALGTSPEFLLDSVTAFTASADGSICASRENGSVDRLTRMGTARVTSIDSTVHILRFNSKNVGYAVTDRGIISLSSSKLFFPDSLQNSPFTIDDFWNKPRCAFVDSDDNLWVGFNYGEWGGNIVVFDTKTEQFKMIEFDTLRPSSAPIMSLFEGKNGVIYATSGLMHFDIAGGIFAIENFKAKLIYDKFAWNVSENDITNVGEYIGPGAFNEKNKQVLYYSNLGFSYASYEDGLFCSVSYWKPRLLWRYGQSMAVGYGMNVTKIQFTKNGSLVFLTTANGIGFLNGDHLIFYK
ncbi:NHL repeat-containing protein [Dawidia soli]|uniref:Lipoprotein n=1 Tax=Dawidia soli TaxID=2782352 RepID=A0AAP2D8E3_9BACT|nr:hypothetical protein [Dawidia soli]MBT1686852.1 hypothetical protein [Dawidia soli]